MNIKKINSHIITNQTIKLENNKIYVGDITLKTGDIIEFRCDICNKINSFKYASKETYKNRLLRNINGCQKCVNKYYIKEKYGVDNISQLDSVKKKVKATNIRKFGVKSILCDRDIVETGMLNKYGVRHPSHSKKITDKIKNTNISKYGAEYYFQTDESKLYNKDIQNKKMYNKLINSDRLGGFVTPLFNIDEYKGTYIDYKYKWKCNKCEKEFVAHIDEGKIPRCLNCFPNNSSIYELEIGKYLDSLSTNYESNNRKVLNGKELDIYIPSHKLAIEFNGLYWHSESKGKDKNYHLNKTIECEKQGIQLLHIFEDEWLDKQDIIKNIIKIKLGLIGRKIYGRKTVIKELKSKECKDFLESFHMQGHIPAKVNLGLFYEDELVSLLTFGSSRYNKQYDWEILRYVNKLDTSVIGGFSKLLKSFIKNYEGSIITYSDRRLFNGKIYESNGFTKLKPSKQGYYYFKSQKRFNRQQFMKHKLESKLDIFDPLLTEYENMQMNGWDRIWDCGNNIYIIK